MSLTFTDSFARFRGQVHSPLESQKCIKRKNKFVVTARSTEKASEKNQGQDSSGSSGESQSVKNKPSSLDRIEMQAKSSIDRLKDILYRLKTRPSSSEKSQSESGAPALARADEIITSNALIINKEQELYISQKIEVDLSTDVPNDAEIDLEMEDEGENESDSKVEVSFPEPGLMESSVQLDAITYTNTTVQFDEETQTAIVTVSATVREADLGDLEAYAERAVAMATRALARTCLALDEKAQLAVLTKSQLAVSPTTTLSQHREIIRQLSMGKVVSGEGVQEGHGSTPFRQVYKLMLADESGWEIEALFKPVVPGDKFNRWSHAPAEWVAYQVTYFPSSHPFIPL